MPFAGHPDSPGKHGLSGCPMKVNMENGHGNSCEFYGLLVADNATMLVLMATVPVYLG